jgi:DNA-binding CsgD family transcriptional regulator/PAS domain-containing protein
VSKRTNGMDKVELSDLIGEIYDCVIDPTRWEPTLDRIRGLLCCTSGALVIADLRNDTTRIQSLLGIEPEWAARYRDYSTDVAAGMSSVPDLLAHAPDEPFVGRRDVGEEVFESNRFWREWMVPQGHVDFAGLHLMQSSNRVTDIVFGRHHDVGLITEREVRLLRLLAPHLRRAVIISDLVDMKSIEAEALGHTLDMVPTGVVLVSEDSKILHANRSAGRMIDEAAPVFSVGGRLSVPETETARQLHQVVRTAARNEAGIGGAGIGMALNGHAGPPATAHVLPIANGALRSRLIPKGVAAVFIASDGHQPPLSLKPVADAFGLSRAEMRVLERLMQGDSLPHVAAALGVSQNTAKTHLSRIFAKTGTRRQANLVALVTKLMPPITLSRGARD